MTPEERAEKILMTNVFIMCEKDRPCYDVTLYECLKDDIAAEIRAAVEEAEIALDKRCEKMYSECIDEAVEEAYEDAAKIVESWFFQALGKNEEAEQWLANKIRARAKEVGK